MTQAIQKAPEKAVEKSRYAEVKKLLEDNAAAIKERLPKHLTPDRMLKVSLTIIHKTPLLQECTTSSLVQCVLDAAELGLEPGSALGHCYLVPYKRHDKKTNKNWMEAQLQVGYKGFIELSLRSGRTVDVDADVIHEHDTWSAERGTDSKLKHIPNFGKPGAMVAAYAVATLANGVKKYAIVSEGAGGLHPCALKGFQLRPLGDGLRGNGEEDGGSATVQAAQSEPRARRAVEVDEQDFVEVQAVELEPTPTRTEELKAHVKKLKPPAIVDVLPGEAEETAEARAKQEPELTQPPEAMPLPGEDAYVGFGQEDA
jgi:phage RecT family recombinase